MTKLSIYIAGPMTGLPELNFPAFHAEAARLRAMGHTVLSPAEINPDKHMTWQECMRTDIAALVTCDAIQLLPGWMASKGATLEHHIAEGLGLIIYLPLTAKPATNVSVTPGNARKGESGTAVSNPGGNGGRGRN